MDCMRYVLVCVCKGNGGKFNNKLREDVFKKFNAKSSKLPAHFTIKAPFEATDENIKELTSILNFISDNFKSSPYFLKDYDSFRKNVIFMDVIMPEETLKLHNNIIKKLKTLSWLTFSKTEGFNPKFHVTVTSKKIENKFDEIMDYVINFPVDFEEKYDNLSLFKWDNFTWNLVKEFKLQS